MLSMFEYRFNGNGNSKGGETKDYINKTVWIVKFGAIRKFSQGFFPLKISPY